MLKAGAGDLQAGLAAERANLVSDSARERFELAPLALGGVQLAFGLGQFEAGGRAGIKAGLDDFQRLLA